MKKLVSILTIIIIISCNGYAFFNKTVYAEDGENEGEQTIEPVPAPTTPEPEPEPQPEPQPESEPTEAPKADLVPTTAPAKTNNSTTKSTTNKNTTTAKSSNANLSDLGIKPKEYDFKGFKSGTTSYSLEVENNVTEVEVYAKAQDTKAKISGTGKKTLQEGNNALEVIVTAENGTKKTYTINVSRKASAEEEKPQEEKKEEKVETKEVKGLSELKIAGIEMSPKFNPEVYSYTVNYTGTDTKLDITTKAGDANSTVEITGNENLVEGENLINILVTDKDGKIYTYQVTVKKSLAKQNEKFSIKNIIIIAVVGIGLLGIGIFAVKKIRNRNNIEEDSEDYEEEIEKIEEFEKNNKKAYVNSILQTSVDEEDEKEVVQQDSWFKKEMEKEKNGEYGGPIIYEPEDNYSELKIEKPAKKKGRAKGKRFK